jgi:tetratricopeptide (TPR) repeat protein
MKKIVQYLVFSLLFCLSAQLIQAQSKYIKKGDNYFKKAEYYMALTAYQDAEKDGETLSLDIRKKMANCYFELNNVDKAYEFFAEIEDKLSGNDVFTYATVLHKIGFYGEEGEESGAIHWYRQAAKQGADPIKVNDAINACKWAGEHLDYVDYLVNPTTVLTFGQSFGIQYYKDGVVYSSSEEGSKNVDRTGKSFLNLYYSDLVGNEIQKGRLFSKSLVFPFHIGAISFTSDYNTMYYTRVVRIKGGDSKLKLFKVTYDGKGWGNETELSFNNEDYDYGHPAVSPDDKFLYFVSNQRGGYGGKDIYRVERLRGGMYGKIKNLGPEINTYGDEEFPFISKDGIMYFSSDGHMGFGGLDLFKAEYQEGTWKNVENMYQPFNSSYDDFAYSINPKNPDVGFLSSNRRENQDIIWTVSYTGEKEDETPKIGDVIDLANLPEEKPVVTEKPKVDLSMFPSLFSAKVKSSFNSEPAVGIKVDIIDDASGKVVCKGVSDASGKFNINIPDEFKKEGQEFELVFSKEGEFNSKRMIVNIKEIADLNDNGLSMTPIFNDDVLDDISGMILYYVGDELTEESKKTLDRLATYLQRNSEIVVKLNAHTDARGNKLGNLMDSQNMGEKVESMLMQKGVDGNATIPRGYGERYIVNKCGRGKLCSDAEHLKNRRVEVVVWRVKK